MSTPHRLPQFVGAALLLATALPAVAQIPQRVIVTSDQALIYSRQVHLVMAKAKVGTVLDVVGRESNFYVVVIPPELGGQQGRTGLIAISQVEPAPSSATPDSGRPNVPSTERLSAERAMSRRQTTGVPTPVRVLGFGQFGYGAWLANNTFNAVLGSAGAPMFGGGIRVQKGSLFVDGGFDWFQSTGQRVFVHNGSVFDLGIPDTVKVIPIAATVGYRWPGRSVTPYVGGGAGVTLYRESSDFALASDNHDQAYAAYHVLGGAEFTTRRLVGFAVEGQFTTVPGALGASGASAAFDEHNLGGVQVRVRVLVGKR